MGVLHGPRNGHLLIYCNAKVLMVDFNVHQTKSYPFFIEEELCEIQLVRTPKHYQYNFHINQEADTPRNRVRKQTEKKYRRQTFAFFGSIALLVIIVATFAIRYDDRREAEQQQAMLEKASEYTVGHVIATEKKDEVATIKYQFTVDNRSIEGRANVPLDSLAHLFPIAPEDEFYVRYVWFRPGLNSIELDRPSKKQITRYFKQTAERHTQLHPELSKTQVLCLIDLAYEIDSLPGLTKFYLQDLLPEENPYYNRDSYQRLIRDIPFARERERRCW